MGFYDYGLLDDESAPHAPTFWQGRKVLLKQYFKGIQGKRTEAK
jgi:hypothetical protein